MGDGVCRGGGKDEWDVESQLTHIPPDQRYRGRQGEPPHRQSHIVFYKSLALKGVSIFRMGKAGVYRSTFDGWVVFVNKVTLDKLDSQC